MTVIATVMGNIGRVETFDKYTRFSVASNSSQDGEKVTEWYSCTAWDSLATRCKVLEQGAHVTVVGRLTHAKKGNDVYQNLKVTDFVGGMKFKPATGTQPAGVAAPTANYDDVAF